MAKSRQTPRLPRRMAPTDALFWYGESALPTFRPIIAGLYVLDREPEADALRAVHETALEQVPRLRQRVLEAPLHLGLPEYVDDPHFDPDYHLRHVSLPAPGTLRELLDLAASVFATPLDRERPLWEAYWIDGLDGGRAAYFFKMHHCLVDGVGSLAIMDALTQRDPDAPTPRPAAPEPERVAGSALDRLGRLAGDAAGEAARLVRRAARLPGSALAHPLETAEQVARTARGLRGMLSDLTATPTEDPLVAEGTSGLSRRLDVIQIPLERLRKLKAPMGISVNDLVLTALCGALRAYHRERGFETASLHCMVPMSLRGRAERDELGNRVGVFDIALPLEAEQIEERLDRIVAQTRAAKQDQRGAAWPLLIQALPLVPGQVVRFVGQRSLGKVNVACTNIPGVRSRRWLAGARVDALYPFASVVEGTPLVMALLSYAGSMDIGIDTDPEAIPDPHRVAELFLAELEAIEELRS